MDRVAAQEVWSRAHDFAALCVLGARFLEGELPFFPGWMAADVDDETDALAHVLAAACRGGFLTVASQPGSLAGRTADGRALAQRAFVTGFAREDTAARLARLGLSTALCVASYAATEAAGGELPVGRMADEAYLFSGGAYGPAELELFAGQVPEAALAELRGARYVSVIDLEWGRDDVLWPALARVFGERV
jgi:hypothetical protein